MIQLLEFKDSFGAIEDVDMKGRRVTGYLSEWGLDKHNDIIEKGAYAKTIKERKGDIRFLAHHNWEKPFGGFEELSEESKGLRFVSQPFVEGVSYHDDTIKLYDAGILNEHSVGFVTMKDEVKDGVRYIKEIKLYEGSVVTIGANSQTPFTGFKSNIEQIQDQTKKIMKALRSGTFTDDTFTLLEIALKQLQLEAVEYGKSLAKPDASTSTQEPIDQVKAIYDYLNERK